ncbi:MAG: 30S ribosomal protein S21 [Candidatus Pacebacteria bacterium]|nr:30S ribosomal protein S21 [Candidatus Paceibacterota bacterium]
MATNVDIKRTKNDNNLGLLRKFSRKVKISSVLPEKRRRRYFEREMSDFKKKANALNKIEKRAEYEKKEKMGLLKPRRRGRR